MNWSAVVTGRRARTVFRSLLLLVGLGLLMYGSYAHLSVANTARCDFCAPWYPLFVLAPLSVGGAFVLSSVYLLLKN